MQLPMCTTSDHAPSNAAPSVEELVHMGTMTYRTDIAVPVVGLPIAAIIGLIGIGLIRILHGCGPPL